MVRAFLPRLAFAIACLSGTAMLQGRFVDDAGRSVMLPPRISRVFAAGAPAEVMLYTLAPDLLAGRNMVPRPDTLEFLPPAYRNPTPIRQLPEVDNPAADAELLALKPDVYIDYGTVNDDYVQALEAVERRTRVPGVILDGALPRIPAMYRQVGAALGVKERGERLAGVAERVLAKYQGTAASVRVYLACSADGYVPCLDDERAGEQLRWLGGINVAGTRATSPRRPLTIGEIRKLAPHVIVVNGSAARLREDPAWRDVEAVAAGRVFQWPAVPYGWGPRPPSVNRLPGLPWLSYVAQGKSFDAEFGRDIRELFREMYHLELTEPQFKKLFSL
jgi:iron complex transport system substrate-binding protein